MPKKVAGYVGQILRADLSSHKLSKMVIDEVTLRQYLGGTGLGIKILYDELSPDVKWDSPENLLIFATGPLNSTKIGGAGTFSVVTKGAMTKGATSTQGSGFMGAYMKFSGFDALVLEGKSSDWVYLYLHGGVAELRDASHLVGKGTFETEELIKKELGYGHKELSVFSIGIAGENLVRFAAIVGDGGHVMAHNGVGAVMGSKKLKAIAAARKPAVEIEIHDPNMLSVLKKEVMQNILANPRDKNIYLWGTSTTIGHHAKAGLLPVKNYTTNEIPDNIDKFMGTYYRERFRLKREPCWACQMHHCHSLEVTEGPYKGLVSEEPEYEQMASWGPQIGVSDPGAAIMLSKEADSLGLDANEGSWITGLVMECYEKGILGKKDTGGLEMTWGNAEAVRVLLYKIACREGIGNILAEGVKDATRILGGPTPEMGIYTLKGTTPRAHDDRGAWQWMLDHCTSNTGVNETMGGADLREPDYPLKVQPFADTDVAKYIANRKGILQFHDSLVLCFFAGGPILDTLVQMVGAVTGWDFTNKEALLLSRRIATLMKVFNLKHGLTTELDTPSPRYGSSQVNGALKAKSVIPVWPQMRRSYYEAMGWHPESGKPLPETLRMLGLEHVIGDLWSK